MLPTSGQVMALSFCVYLVGSLVYANEGKVWMAATLALYAASIGTLYMAGEH